MVKSVTACSEAATALPGSTWRLKTTPSMGETMAALLRLVLLVDKVAWACSTEALALSTAAWLRAAVARAASMSVKDGIPPRDCLKTSSKRASWALASRAVASAWVRCAWAEAKAARACCTWSLSLAGSSSMSTCPRLTRSFTSTRTACTVPDNSLPTLTWRTGCKVPLALTVRVMSPRAKASVTYCGLTGWALRPQSHPAAASNTNTPTASHARRRHGEAAGFVGSSLFKASRLGSMGFPVFLLRLEPVNMTDSRRGGLTSLNNPAARPFCTAPV